MPVLLLLLLLLALVAFLAAAINPLPLRPYQLNLVAAGLFFAVLAVTLPQLRAV